MAFTKQTGPDRSGLCGLVRTFRPDRQLCSETSDRDRTVSCLDTALDFYSVMSELQQRLVDGTLLFLDRKKLCKMSIKFQSSTYVFFRAKQLLDADVLRCGFSSKTAVR